MNDIDTVMRDNTFLYVIIYYESQNEQILTEYSVMIIVIASIVAKE